MAKKKSVKTEQPKVVEPVKEVQKEVVSEAPVRKKRCGRDEKGNWIWK